MQVTEIVVNAGRTFNHPYEDYSNLRPSVTLKATLNKNDDPDKAVQELQAKAEKLVEDHKQNMLESLDELHHLTLAQREMQNLEDSLKRAQERLGELREKHTRLLTDNTEIPY